MRARPEPPETKSALLITAGDAFILRVTRHIYQSTERGTDHQGKPGWVHMFRCLETGVTRVWGFHGTRGDSDGDDE